MPRLHHLAEPIDPPPIDLSSADHSRTSFRTTDFDSILPVVRARYPLVDLVYITKIFRGTIGPNGLIWLDIDRQDTSPLEFSDIAHLLYCLEIYSQIVCILARPQGVERQLELLMALAEYRIRLLKLSKWATFASLKDWFKASILTMLRNGQDNPEGWRQNREDLTPLLRKKM